jgi:hypothetical protein
MQNPSQIRALGIDKKRDGKSGEMGSENLIK